MIFYLTMFLFYLDLRAVFCVGWSGDASLPHPHSVEWSGGASHPHQHPHWPNMPKVFPEKIQTKVGNYFFFFFGGGGGLF